MTQIKLPVSSSRNVHSIVMPGSLLQGTCGPVPYNMTNDYMFRAVLQSNNKVLFGLICSLLHLPESDIISVEVTNPIILGESLEEKESRLDINICLNGRQHINLEMQIANRLNWQNRSLLYLCRSFGSLGRGQDYVGMRSALHIGFLDYTLFKEYPEFYATYKLMNMKNHHVYSDNFVLSVIDLTHIELASEEDKKYHIDSWARLFKAATWEEIRMLASKTEYLGEAADSIFRFNSDERIRKLCRDREEYYEDIRNYERVIAEKDASIAEKDFLIQKLSAEIERLQRK